ncbi:MAG: TIM barrel protein [Gemmatimonadota bacterium]
MIDMTAGTEVGGTRFDGIDLNVMAPHLDIDADEAETRKFADMVAQKGLKIGSVGAPVWPDAGGGSAMGSAEERARFLDAVRKTCEYARVLNDHGVRQYGIIRIDSAASPMDWADDPAGNTTRVAKTFREAADIAADCGERLAAEGEICWAGMHSWRHMLDLLEETDRPDTLGFQADLSHTYLYLLGYNAPDHALLLKEYSEEEFWEAYEELTDKLGPWTIDFHVAQSDGTVFGSGAHDKTGRHCPPDDPAGKLDVVRCARHWLLDENGQIRNNIKHMCWDGCMFPNRTLESADTWESVLTLLKEVRDDIAQHQHADL